MRISEELKKKYTKQYLNEDSEWRMIGAKGKAENICKIFKEIKPKKVLDVGSGDGSVLFWLDKFKFSNNIVSSEISKSGIEKIKSRKLKSVTKVILFDGYKLPFKNNEFDLALCSHVIEHIEYPRMLIREICRVSKKQIFEIPIDFSFNIDKNFDHYMSYGHINVYSPQTFRYLLKTEGLNIEKYINNLYSKSVYNYMNRNKTLIKRFFSLLIRLIRRYNPILMKFKPNTTTVLTSKNKNKLQIMK